MNIVSGLLEPADQATPAEGQPQTAGVTPAPKRTRRARAAPAGGGQGAEGQGAAGNQGTGSGGEGAGGQGGSPAAGSGLDLGALLEEARRGCSVVAEDDQPESQVAS